MTRYGVNAIREGVRARVVATSLRSVAAAVGLSINAVKGFLAGANPHASSIKKYSTYLASAEHPKRDRTEASQERANVDAAIAELNRYIDAAPEKGRARRLREVLQRLPIE